MMEDINSTTSMSEHCTRPELHEGVKSYILDVQSSDHHELRSAVRWQFDGGSDEEFEKEDCNRIRLGICAMNKKSTSKPMMNILSRIKEHDYVEIIMFSDDVILNSPVEHWPVCDCLIAFFSKGFPLEKAIDYVKLRKPLVLNDLQMQYSLMDREKVYEKLVESGVEVPRYTVVNRSDDTNENVTETDDMVEIKGQVFHKPFVEKPVSAEDHNIYIYFPSDYGGGSQRLFRKVHNRSSAYSSESSVRKTGSYIYEDFLATDGTDVKVYTVGPDYAHAEARKSPALDGKVERDEKGKEVRYPVILTAKEKLIARQVCLAFKQTVCGFDLLRANGKSYVCDVNGFSFVKNSQKYYDDCAQILLEMITAQLAPYYFPPIPPSVEYLAEEIPDLPVSIPKTGNQLELRCVIGVIRHGDRTPKQKMKMVVTHRRFFQLFEELNGYKKGNLKIKKPKELQKVLNIACDLLDQTKSVQCGEFEEQTRKLIQLKTVLEMYSFSGINRKIQFKILNKENDSSRLLLILKWGGELTLAGKMQAEELGQVFRCTYPGGEGEYSSLPGSGFLRLHSTYRHDLKVYASDEGRVQLTAAAFTKGLLDLEGSLASILVHLVRRDEAANDLLDTSTDAQDTMNIVKERLHSLMHSSEDFTGESISKLAPTHSKALLEAMDKVKNPREKCEQLHQQIKALLEEGRRIADGGAQYTLDHSESLQLMINRWAKLEKDFKLSSGRFDISKIPDIYDCIKYDLLHNNSTLHLKTAKELFDSARPLADIVIPQEYGITEEEKVDIAKKICTPLLRKIHSDLRNAITDEDKDFQYCLDPQHSTGVVRPKKHLRTRLYFTSESHTHSLANILKYGGLLNGDDLKWKESTEALSKCPELNYMTQIIFMLFEDKSQPQGSLERYRVDIHFSPGVKTSPSFEDTVPNKSTMKTIPDPNLSMFIRRKSHGISEDTLLKSSDHHHATASQRSCGTLEVSKTRARNSNSESMIPAAEFRKRVSIDYTGVPSFYSHHTPRNLSSTSVEPNSMTHSTKRLPIRSFSEGKLDLMASRPGIPNSKPVVHISRNSSGHSSCGSDEVVRLPLPELGEEGTCTYKLVEQTSSIESSNEHREGQIMMRRSSSNGTWSDLMTPLLADRGLELVAGLASQMEPLLPVAFLSLDQANTFLTCFTGATPTTQSTTQTAPPTFSRHKGVVQEPFQHHLKESDKDSQRSRKQKHAQVSRLSVQSTEGNNSHTIKHCLCRDEKHHSTSYLNSIGECQKASTTTLSSVDRHDGNRELSSTPTTLVVGEKRVNGKKTVSASSMEDVCDRGYCCNRLRRLSFDYQSIVHPTTLEQV